jgi:hypothetical protein
MIVVVGRRATLLEEERRAVACRVQCGNTTKSPVTMMQRGEMHETSSQKS